MPRAVTIVSNATKPQAPVERLSRALVGAGDAVTVRITRTLPEGRAVAREAVSRGADVLVAAGGDGTLLSVVDAAAGTGVAVGLLPLGTANDLAVALGLDLAGAAAAIERGRGRELDTVGCEFQGFAGEDALSFCTTAGVGLFATVVSWEKRRRGRMLLGALGAAGWPVLTVWAAAHVTDVPATLRFDGRELRRSVQLLDVCNVEAMGGFPVSPGTTPDSGMLHLWTFGGTRLRDRVAMTLGGASGRAGHLAHRAVLRVSGDPSANALGLGGVTALDVETDAPLPLHVQGDHVGSTPARFRLQPRSLRVLA